MSELLRRYGLNHFYLDKDEGGGGGSGGTGEEGGEGEEEDPPKPKGKTMTQSELDALAKREVGTGRRRALEDLGFANDDEAKAELARLREIEAKGLSDLEKKQKEADERERTANKATEAANAATLTTRVERALERAGVSVETSSEVRLMVNVAHDITEEDLATTVQALKKKLPSLFEKTESSEGEAEEGKPPAGGDPGKKPPGGSKVTDKKAEAEKRLLAMHPEIAERRARQASVTT